MAYAPRERWSLWPDAGLDKRNSNHARLLASRNLADKLPEIADPVALTEKAV